MVVGYSWSDLLYFFSCDIVVVNSLFFCRKVFEELCGHGELKGVCMRCWLIRITSPCPFTTSRLNYYLNVSFFNHFLVVIITKSGFFSQKYCFS